MWIFILSLLTKTLSDKKCSRSGWNNALHYVFIVHWGSFYSTKCLSVNVRTWLLTKKKETFLWIVVCPNAKARQTQIANIHCVRLQLPGRLYQTTGRQEEIGLVSFSLWCQTEGRTVNRVLLLPPGVDRGSQRAALQLPANLMPGCWSKGQKTKFRIRRVATVTAECVSSLDTVCEFVSIFMF